MIILLSGVYGLEFDDDNNNIKVTDSFWDFLFA